MGGFLLNGLIDVRLLAAVPAAPLAPTQAEMNAGTPLVGAENSEELTAINGFRLTSEGVATGGYAGLNVGSLTGSSSYAASSLVWRADSVVEVIFSAVAKSATQQWLAFSQKGHGAGLRSTIFPVTISNRQEGLDPVAAQVFEAFFSLDVPYDAVQAA